MRRTIEFLCAFSEHANLEAVLLNKKVQVQYVANPTD